MPVDPTDPDTFEDEEDPSARDVEAPRVDAEEQHTELTPHRDESPAGGDPASSNEADRAEQARVIELNEDEYR